MTSRATKDRLARRLMRAALSYAKAHPGEFYAVRIHGRDLQFYAGDPMPGIARYTDITMFYYDERREFFSRLGMADNARLMQSKEDRRYWLERARNGRLESLPRVEPAALDPDTMPF